LKSTALSLIATPLLVIATLAGRIDAVARTAPDAERGAPERVASSGPDLAVGSISGITGFGALDGVAAYSIGTTACNLGDEMALWCATSVPGLCGPTQHPVTAQNLYRLSDGRFEQVGMSWLRHGVCALDSNFCGPCTADPFGCSALGAGCSDPYSASTNGTQSLLGPRSEVNASTGALLYPFAPPVAPTKLDRRIQVPLMVLDPAQNHGALYFAEAHYVSADDAAAGHANNNASFRQVLVGAFSNGAFVLQLTGSTVQQKHAIHAWKEHGLGIGLPDPEVSLQNIDVEGDGRFIVGHRVHDNRDGTWSYEYAVFNQNSDRAARSWRVPVPAGVTVTMQEQNIVNHHSGEPYSTAPWIMSTNMDALLWQTAAAEDDLEENALRWGTLFNFRFVADAPPTSGVATLGLLGSGPSRDPGVIVLGPSAPSCLADLSGDGTVDGADLALVLGAWGTSGSADLDQSGGVDGADLAIVLGSWGQC